MGQQNSIPSCSSCTDGGRTAPAPIKIDGAEIDRLLGKNLVTQGNGEKEKAQREEEVKLEAERKEEERLAAECAAAEEAQRELQHQELERIRQDELRAEAERSRKELEAAREQQRIMREKAEADRQAEVQRAKQEAEKVTAFLSKYEFKNIKDLKKMPAGFMRTRKCAPLHLAVELNDSEMVKLLVAAGSDKNQTNSKGQKAFDLAKKLGQENASASELLALLNPKQISYAGAGRSLVEMSQ